MQKLLPSPAPPLALVPPLLLELPLPVPAGVPPAVGFVPPDAEEAGVPPVPAVPLGAVPAPAVPDEPLEVVAKLLPLAPTPSELPWAVDNLRFCNWCDQLTQKDLNDCPYCGRRMEPLAPEA